MAQAQEVSRAQTMLAQLAAEDVRQQAMYAVAGGRAEWILDPEAEGVVGLVVTGTNRAAVVVYLHDRDFEVDEELLAQLAGDDE